MKLKTLEALQMFVMNVKHHIDGDSDIQKAGDELDSMLETEIKIKKAIAFVDVPPQDEDKIEAVRKVRILLEALNTQIHQGVPVNGNGRILTAMEALDVAFQVEFGIGQQ